MSKIKEHFLQEINEMNHEREQSYLRAEQDFIAHQYFIEEKRQALISQGKFNVVKSSPLKDELLSELPYFKEQIEDAFIFGDMDMIKELQSMVEPAQLELPF